MAAEEKLVGAWAVSMARMDAEQEAMFIRRQQTRKLTVADYVAGTTRGSALPDAVRLRGPAHYAWAIESTRKADVLRFHEREAAFALAIAQLNDLAALVRSGGLKEGRCYAREGFNEQDLRDVESFAISDLAETMVKLRAFGAIA